jgi:hypothetical protein
MIEDPTQTLTRVPGSSGRASGETIPVVDNHQLQLEVSPHSSRAIPDWQVLQTGRRREHARRHLSC